MKSLQSFILVAAFATLFLGTSNTSYAQDGEGFLMVTVYQSANDKAYNKIIVTEDNEVLDEIDLKKIYYKDLAEISKKINQVLDRYNKFGYELKETVSAGSIGAGSKFAHKLTTTTYLFQKE